MGLAVFSASAGPGLHTKVTDGGAWACPGPWVGERRVGAPQGSCNFSLVSIWSVFSPMVLEVIVLAGTGGCAKALSNHKTCGCDFRWLAQLLLCDCESENKGYRQMCKGPKPVPLTLLRQG